MNRAQTLNLQAATEGVPFIPEDFLGLANREERLTKAKAEQNAAEIAAAIENAKLLEFKTGVKQMDDSDIPAWAKGGKKRGR